MISINEPFQFTITRVDDSAPLIKRGTLSYCVKRLDKKLKFMKNETEEEKMEVHKIKIIRNELRKLKNEL